MKTWRTWLALPGAVLLLLSFFLLLWANQPSARWQQAFLVSESQAVAQPASATGANVSYTCLFIAGLPVIVVLLLLVSGAWSYFRGRGRKNLKWLGIGAGALLASCCAIAVVIMMASTRGGSMAPAAAPTMAAPSAPTSLIVTSAPTLAPVPPPEPAATATPPAFYMIAPTPAPPALEERIVELEWPEGIRLGDSDLIRLTFKPRPAGGFTPTVEFGGHEVEPGEVSVPELSATHYAFAIARLDASGFDVQPGGEQEQELLPGQTLTYRWTLKAKDAGRQRVALSLTMRWEPKPGVDDRVRTATVWDRALEVRVRTALGFSGAMGDWFGIGGSLLGTVMGFPFIETVLTGLWKRLRRQ
jgi:hypothetical protein